MSNRKSLSELTYGFSINPTTTLNGLVHSRVLEDAEDIALHVERFVRTAMDYFGLCTDGSLLPDDDLYEAITTGIVRGDCAIPMDDYKAWFKGICSSLKEREAMGREIVPGMLPLYWRLDGSAVSVTDYIFRQIDRRIDARLANHQALYHAYLASILYEAFQIARTAGVDKKIPAGEFAKRFNAADEASIMTFETMLMSNISARMEGVAYPHNGGDAFALCVAIEVA